MDWISLSWKSFSKNDCEHWLVRNTVVSPNLTQVERFTRCETLFVYTGTFLNVYYKSGWTYVDIRVICHFCQNLHLKFQDVQLHYLYTYFYQGISFFDRMDHLWLTQISILVKILKTQQLWIGNHCQHSELQGELTSVYI